jgi:predicted permease
MNDLRRDIRYALRMLSKNPGFTMAAVLTLALGIGLNTAVFGAVYSMLLRPLPGADAPDRIVQLYRSWASDFLWGANSVPHYYSVKEENDVFESVAVWSFIPVNLSGEGASERIAGELVSADYFSVFGVRPELGRAFLSEEDEGPGQHPVAVLSHAFWQARFGGDPGVLGQVLTLNGQPFEVVGVAPADFHGAMPAVRAAVYVPLTMQRELMPGRDRFERRGSNFLSMVARLRDGVTVEQASQAMDALARGLEEQYPGDYEGNWITVVSQQEAGIHPTFTGTQRSMSALMMGVVGLLLLIACVNVANLFLARGRDRQREMAVRLSIGARRRRIIRQLLTEAVLFAAVAGGAGLVLAFLAVRVLNGVQVPSDFPIDFDIAVSTPVLVFTLGISLVTGLVFGLAPALTASRPELVTSLKGDVGGRGRSRSRATRALVGVQVALSLVLLVSAGLFLRNLQAATELEKGFDADHLMLASVDPGLQGYDWPRIRAFYHQLVDRVRRYPDVRAAGLAEMVPLGLGSQQTGIDVPGYEPGPDEVMSIDYNLIADGYFDAMGIRLLRGRAITDQDGADAPGVMVINERFAERYWPGDEAVGKRVLVGSTEREVVGVVEDGKYRSLGEDPLPYMYLPWEQSLNSEMTLHVRTAGPPEAMAARIREEVRSLDPQLPIYDVRTMENHLGISMLPARLGGFVLGIFGVLGLVLAAVGIYGVMAYSVAQRTREIGIRVAVGAARRQVIGMVVRQGMGVVVLGTAVGLVGAFGAARLVQGLLYTESALDPLTFVAVPAVLLAAAGLATYLPARRAAGVDPVRALKAE